MIRVENRVAYLFYLLSKETNYVTSAYLGKKINLTDRTVKSEVISLKKYANKNGAYIISKRRLGYKLVVFDKTVYENKIEQLEYRFSLVKFFEEKDLQQRTNEILRFVLVQKKYLDVDDIAEYMGLSVSSIKSEIKLLNHLLKESDLRFKKHNEKGDLIIGDELNIRMLMLFVYDLYYHDAIASYKNVDYLNLFKIKDELRIEVRHMFLKNLRNSNLKIIDNNTQMLSRYLCLMANRFNNGYRIDATKFKDVKQYEQYRVAKKIFKEISQYSYFEVDDNEVMAFALLLLFVTDIQPDYELNEYKDLYKKAVEINHFIDLNLSDFFKIKVSDFFDSDDIFSSVTIMLAAEIKYDLFVFFNSSNLYRNSSQSVALFNPMTLFIAKYIAFVFKKTYNYTVCDYYIANLSLCFEHLLKKVKYTRKKLRVIVFDVRGINKANIVKDYLFRILGDYFSDIKTYELYELRSIDLDEIDFVIGNAPRFTFKYTIDYIFINNILDKESITIIYDYIFKNSLCIDKYVPIFDDINYYLDYDYLSEKAFIKIIANKYSRDNITEKTIEEYFSKNLFTCVSGILIIFIPINYTKKCFVDFYNLKKTSYWENNNVEKILILSADISNKFIFKFVCDLSSIFLNQEKDIEFYLEKATFNKSFLINLIKKYCIY